MSNENFIENIAAGFGQNASVKNVFGEPIRSGDKTIIPVARIAYGFGGGYGKGNKKHKKEDADMEAQSDEGSRGKGAGGGGGFSARAKGVYEITPTCTRFIPANPAQKVLIGIAIGFLLKKFFFSKKKK